MKSFKIFIKVHLSKYIYTQEEVCSNIYDKFELSQKEPNYILVHNTIRKKIVCHNYQTTFCLEISK